MKLFLSHASRDKATIDRFRGKLPASLTTWLDVNEIAWSERLETSLENAIQADVDYLLIFLARDTLNSSWVKRELGWAFEREKKLGRTFVLPVILEKEAITSLPPELSGRRYLSLPSFSNDDIDSLAQKATEKLFELILKEYASLKTKSVNAPPQLHDVVEQALRGGYDKRDFWTRPMLQLPPQNTQDVFRVMDAARDATVRALQETAGIKVSASKIRTNIFLPTSEHIGKGDVCTLMIPEIELDTRLQLNMKNERERLIRFRPSVGATGRVFADQQAVGALSHPSWLKEKDEEKRRDIERWVFVRLHPEADLSKPGEALQTDSGKSPFQMSDFLNRQVDKDVAWIISMPIILKIQDRREIVGVFNVDCLKQQLQPHILRAIYYRLVPFAGAISGVLKGSPFDRVAIFAIRNR